MNYSFLKNAEAGTVFQLNGLDVIVCQDKTNRCQYCVYATGKRDGSKSPCEAPRNTGIGNTPCGRGGLSSSVRYIPLHLYAKLRIKGEI